MDGEVDGVISGRIRAIAENRIVEKIGEGGEGPVEAGGVMSVPVFLRKDESRIVTGRRLDSRILQDDGGVIERHVRAKRIRIGQDGESDYRQNAPGMRPDIDGRSSGGRRNGLFGRAQRSLSGRFLLRGASAGFGHKLHGGAWRHAISSAIRERATGTWKRDSRIA
jgi:hypothetical protein